jgi:phospholipid/cholesterol/gamma-HCH transport system substrate-binding protein
MTERQMQVRIGALVLTAILLFVGFVLSVGKRSALFEERYSLWTSFSSTEGLAEGAPVRLAGVTVGNVTRISFGRDLKDRRIVLTLSLEQRVRDRIREDSLASIGTIGLVGDKVLDITVGSADRPALQSGARLASADPLDYSQLAQKGDRILDNVTRITASLDEFLSGGESAEGKRNLSEAVRSLRTTLVQLEKGQGMLHGLIYGREGADLLERVDRTVQSLERTARAIESERGLLHTLIYDTQATEILSRLDRTSQELEGLVRSAREGKGLIPSLFFNPEGAKVLEEIQAAARDMRAVAADLQGITARLRQGEGTIGGLLEDPTVYEDLSALLRGANRSVLLRSLIRSTREEGAQEKR